MIRLECKYFVETNALAYFAKERVILQKNFKHSLALGLLKLNIIIFLKLYKIYILQKKFRAFTGYES